MSTQNSIRILYNTSLLTESQSLSRQIYKLNLRYLKHKEYGLLLCTAAQFRKCPKIRRNISPPSSTSKGKPNKKPAEAGGKPRLLFHHEAGEDRLLRNLLKLRLYRHDPVFENCVMAFPYHLLRYSCFPFSVVKLIY
jgi:hypothetical protein